MAAASHVTSGIYGVFQGGPPFGSGLPSPTRTIWWDTPVQMSLPTGGTVFHPVSPGIQVNSSGNYIYAVIEVLPTGLTGDGHGTKYASNQSVTTLATNAG